MEPSSTSDAAARARRAFHWSLPAVLAPTLGPIFVWFQVLRVRRDVEARATTWARALFALACVDTLVAISVLSLALVGPAPGSDGARDAEPGWLGVRFAPEEPERLGIVEVEAGSPAEEGGVRAGDRILRIDGVAPDPARGCGAYLTPGEPSTLAVLRAGEERLLTVTPRAPPAPAPRPKRGLFEVIPRDAADSAATDTAAAEDDAVEESAGWTCAHELAFLLALLGLRWFGRRRDPAGVGWSSTLATFGAYLVAGLAFPAAVYLALGGWSPAVLVFGLMGASLATLGVGVFTLPRPWCGARVASTVGVGVLYGMASVPRAGALTALAAHVFPGASRAAEVSVLALFEPFALQGPALALFLLDIVLLGPLAEEVLFRGLLQPLLTRAYGAFAAVVQTSVLFAFVHQGYGPDQLGVVGLGLVLGWARARSGGIAAPFALHALWNALAALSLAF